MAFSGKSASWLTPDRSPFGNTYEGVNGKRMAAFLNIGEPESGRPIRIGPNRGRIPNNARNLKIKLLRFLQMPESFPSSAADLQESLIFTCMPLRLLVKANQSSDLRVSHEPLLQNTCTGRIERRLDFLGYHLSPSSMDQKGSKAHKGMPKTPLGGFTSAFSGKSTS